MKDEEARNLLQSMAEGETRLPAWNRVTLRADLDAQFTTRAHPYVIQRYIEVIVYAAIGVALAALGLWGLLCALS